jgi:serine phosphatase RsbU (regulator of sigma subunit)/anti-sigma regulatory factor (Ser/Thr protein kinase)
VTKPEPFRDQERLALLVRAGEIFHRSLDMTATLNNVARLAVESFSDLCVFDLIDERSDRLFVTAYAHRDRSREEGLSSVNSLLHIEEFRVHPVVEVTRTGVPFFLPHIDEATLIAHAASRQHELYMRRFDYRSKIVVPVIAQDHIFGALTFVRTSGSQEFDERDVSFAVELGRRAGLAVANAKQFQREQHVAETLQRAFLPRRFPMREGLQLHAHYRPGSTEADIGGDWYDAFENDAGEIVVTIGDIAGKGIEAARLMVLMRQAIRVAALDTRDPSVIASLCNRLLLAEGERLATAFIGVIDPRTRRIRYASAGHAPPFVRLSDGSVRKLQPPSPPLGAFRNVYYELHLESLESDSMLFLYTDGVIEARRDVIYGEQMLEQVVASNAIRHVANPAEFVERAIEGLAPRDDLAVLVASFSSAESRWQFEAADPRSAYAMRQEFFDTLCSVCRPTEEELANSELIFAELVGNAVRHAPGPLSVSLEHLPDGFVLHVVDSGPGFDFAPTLPASVWHESGRGLYLISTIARDVRVTRVPGGGTHVAVLLPVSVAEVAHAVAI